MWIIFCAAMAILLGVVVIDRRIRKFPGRKLEERLSMALLLLCLILLVASIVWQPTTLAGLALALACANAFIVHQRARSLLEVSRVQAERGQEPAEAPYEQFINTFLSYFDRGEADTLEFEFRQWRMEVRFKKNGQTIPVTNHPFHMLLQIKRLFDAATVKNQKTGESKMRYVARGTIYEFISEDIGGTILRLRLTNKRAAAPDEIKAFDRLLSTVR